MVALDALNKFQTDREAQQMRINDLKYNTLKKKKNLLDHSFKEVQINPQVPRDEVDDQLDAMDKMMKDQKVMLEKLLEQKRENDGVLEDSSKQESLNPLDQGVLEESQHELVDVEADQQIEEVDFREESKRPESP